MSERPVMLTYEFPIRKDMHVKMILPIDITDEEVQRMTRFLFSLVIPKEVDDDESGD